MDRNVIDASVLARFQNVDFIYFSLDAVLSFWQSKKGYRVTHYSTRDALGWGGGELSI